MKNKNFFAALFSAAILSLAVLVAPQASSAQGRYVNQYSKAQVGQIISNLESSSRDFRSDFDRAMDNSQYNGTRDEDRFNGYIRSFHEEVVELRRDFNRESNWWSVRNSVEDVIEDAGPVNNMMTTISFRRNLERQWNRLRNDINKLADTFDLRGINGGGWTGGPWNPGNPGNGNAVDPPSWARGTFYGTSPRGEQIILTINRNGIVTSQIGSGSQRGVYMRGNMISIGGYTSRVENTRDGIRTVSTTNRETINYSKNNGGGGWNPGNPGNAVSPPSWARGTFYGRSPRGEQIVLTIDGNGNATSQVGYGVQRGVYTRGNMLYIDGYTSRVENTRDGIRTVSTTNGETINYSKNNDSGDWDNGSSNAPSWAVGRFTGRNPANGQTIIMTIDKNGRVSVNIGGGMSYGSINGTRLTINGNSSTVTRIRNGIQTVSDSDGQRITYAKN